jgi:adenylate cyclase
MERKLAAILAADVVGYSAHMERDEAGTFERLKASRKDLFEPEIKKRHGRIFKLTGDGLLAEFGSVVDAVECAAALQRGLAERNNTVPASARIEVRIGINLGEVIVDGKDRYGEGVNIAARLEQLAEPGGIWVSAKVAREVEKTLAFGFEPIGELKVKNIASPISAYRVALEGSTVAWGPTKGPLPADKPTLVVLPFINFSGDSDQDWFTDGVVEDMITALSRFRSFAVIARNSSFSYKGRAADVRQVARELGVRYVLEGSVRRAGTQLRITAQLVEGATGAHLWAEHFDGSVADVFAVQDRITADVAMIVGPQIQVAEIERSRRERPGSIAAYDAYLQAVPKINKETAKENAEAYAMLTRALSLEPENALLLSHAAWALGHRSAMGWPPIGPDDVRTCVDLSRRALQRATGDPTVLAHCGLNLLQTGRDYEWGMAVLEAAVNANPNHQGVVVGAGIAHLHCGRVEDALAYFHRAIRLSTADPEAHVSLTGIAHGQMVLGNYSEALVWAGRSLALNTTFDPTFWMLIAANAHLGRMDEAHRFLREFRALAPDVTIATIRAGQSAKDPSRVAAILDGLRIAGLEGE